MPAKTNMSLTFTSLNSGSNGNCYYIGNDSEAVLIDAGISCRETEKRMRRLGLDIKKLKAIFISHEHKDHISGMAVLSKKYQLPVYITEGTHRQSGIMLEKQLIFRFSETATVKIGGLTIHAYKKLHDAGDPHSFVVSSSSVRVGVFTDIGSVCKKTIQHFGKCHAAFLESNYDEDMLMNGSYPYILKKRISDGNGHLSNDEALELFVKHKPGFMSHLILSHLSKNNNTPEIVQDLFTAHANGVKIIVASRYEETRLYTIGGNPVFIQRKKPTSEKHKQLSLFQMS